MVFITIKVYAGQVHLSDQKESKAEDRFKKEQVSKGPPLLAYLADKSKLLIPTFVSGLQDSIHDVINWIGNLVQEPDNMDNSTLQQMKILRTYDTLCSRCDLVSTSIKCACSNLAGRPSLLMSDFISKVPDLMDVKSPGNLMKVFSGKLHACAVQQSDSESMTVHNSSM